MSPKYDPNPAHHWAILTILAADTTTGVDITITTDKASHLTEYWLLKAPKGLRWHRVIRGVIMYCLKKWKFEKPYTLEQAEPGDTLSHTFHNTPWAVCTKRWFCFAGTIGGAATLPTGPIFKYHHIAPPYGPPVTVKFYPTLGSSGVAADGYVAGWTTTTPTWENVWAGVGTYAYDAQTTTRIRFNCNIPPNEWSDIVRTMLHFNTSAIPVGSLITAAKVRLRYYGKANSGPWSPSLALCVSTDLTPGAITPADYQRSGYPLMANKIPYNSWVGGDHFLQIYPALFNWIIPGGVTKLAVREGNYDLPGINPGWSASKTFNMVFYARDYGETLSPYLEVTYQPLL